MKEFHFFLQLIINYLAGLVHQVYLAMLKLALKIKSSLEKDIKARGLNKLELREFVLRACLARVEAGH